MKFERRLLQKGIENVENENIQDAKKIFNKLAETSRKTCSSSINTIIKLEQIEKESNQKYDSLKAMQMKEFYFQTILMQAYLNAVKGNSREEIIERLKPYIKIMEFINEKNPQLNYEVLNN